MVLVDIACTIRGYYNVSGCLREEIDLATNDDIWPQTGPTHPGRTRAANFRQALAARAPRRRRVHPVDLFEVDFFGNEWSGAARVAGRGARR